MTTWRQTMTNPAEKKPDKAPGAWQADLDSPGPWTRRRPDQSGTVQYASRGQRYGRMTDGMDGRLRYGTDRRGWGLEKPSLAWPWPDPDPAAPAKYSNKFKYNIQ